jgi:CO/xanthine dehydrogenase FAD-binding subunit
VSNTHRERPRLEQGRISRAAVALTGVAPTPIGAAAAEAALRGAPSDSSTIAAASQAAVEDLNPTGDLHASAATRIGVARTYVHRALELAVARAQDGG